MLAIQKGQHACRPRKVPKYNQNFSFYPKQVDRHFMQVLGHLNTLFTHNRGHQLLSKNLDTCFVSQMRKNVASMTKISARNGLKIIEKSSKIV